MIDHDLLARNIDTKFLTVLDKILLELKSIKTELGQPSVTTVIQPSTISDYELSRRLGSIMTLDNRGRVFWYDDFEAPSLKWITRLGDGTGDSVTISTAQVHTYDQSVKLIAGTDIVGFASIEKDFIIPIESRIGLEFSVALDATTPSISIEVDLDMYNGVTVHNASLLWTLSKTSLAIKNPDGSTYTEFCLNYDNIAEDHLWHTFKFVVDFSKNTETSHYIRCMTEEKEYDLGLLPVNISNNTSRPHLGVTITNNGDATGNHACYIDDVILTVEEA